MSLRNPWLVRAALVTACVTLAVPAWSQTDIEVNAAIQFNFSTPGARSLGLGGAFLGVADDATAAFSNPAGLTNLSRPEVSLEYRSYDYTHVFTNEGNQGPPTNIGIDTLSGVRQGEADDSASGLSFASFVWPGKNWAIAAYSHELANFEANFQTRGAYLGSEPGDPRYFPTRAHLELDINGYGLAAAFRIGDSFSIGVGAANYTFDIASTTNRFDHRFFGTDPGQFYGEPNYDSSNRVNYQTLVGDDDDIGFQGGFLWSGEKVSLGGVYRQGPDFKFVGSNLNGDGSLTFQSGEGTFSVPDVYGLGMAVRPTDSMTISFDVQQVTYSDLTENTLNVIGCGQGASPGVDCPADSAAQADAAAAKLDVDDATEFHIGFEYVFVNMRYPLALRLGGFSDPDHRIAMQNAEVGNGAEEGLAGLFISGDDEFHYSAGFGLVFGERFQLDAAADFSDRISTYAVSAVYRF